MRINIENTWIYFYLDLCIRCGHLFCRKVVCHWNTGVVLLLVWLNHNLIGAAIRRYRARQAIKQIKKHGTRLSVDLSQCKSVRRNGVARSQGCKSQSLRYSIHGKPSFGMVLAALCFLTFIIVNK